jgi:hypothetical protein
VQGYPERRGKWLVSQDGGIIPQWRGDGRELYWVTPDGALMAAEMKPGQTGMETGKPQALFRVPATAGFPWFQPSKDGKRFLVLEPEGDAGRELPMVVVRNWPAKLGN